MRAAALALRRPPRLPLPAARLRRPLLIGAAALALLAGLYLLWLRDLPLVRVTTISVSGLTTDDAPRLRRALSAAARDMTTLHVDERRLRRAVAAWPAVRELRVRADFPSTLRIEVVERRAAALLASGRSRVPVAGDGSVLRGIAANRSLPELRVSGALPAERLAGGAAVRLLDVVAGAPRSLLGRLRDVRATRGHGLAVRMRRGPELVFGDASRLRAKWAAAARVLADPEARGASYLDLRLPERPAAGGPPASAAAAPVAAVPGATSPAGPAAPQDEPKQPSSPAGGLPQP